MPNAGLELMPPRSRVIPSTNWARQAPFFCSCFNSTFYLEIIVDSHVVERNNMGGSRASLTRSPLSGNSLQNCNAVPQPRHWHRGSRDTEPVPPYKESPCSPFTTPWTSPFPTPHPTAALSLTLATSNLLSISTVLSFQECSMNGITEYSSSPLGTGFLHSAYFPGESFKLLWVSTVCSFLLLRIYSTVWMHPLCLPFICWRTSG